ncbi:MAG: YkgJ family cysteine cluster protein [Phycisphaerales bacterium]|mgnify:CR=1 FL=1|nr:YkgJ family cysteine cluster protein [Phycisphaerales bacterium]
MKLTMPKDVKNLCEQCAALCCRYFAFEIDKPRTKRDFDDLRWYLLHEDCIIFVEDGDWYVQINRPCKALRSDNRCGIYETRPAICRAYSTKGCDYHGDEYDYEQLFVEAEQIAEYAKQYLSKQRKRKAARRKTATTTVRKTSRARKTTGKVTNAPRLLKSA